MASVRSVTIHPRSAQFHRKRRIKVLFSFTRRSRSDVHQSVSQSLSQSGDLSSDLTDVILVSDDS